MSVARTATLALSGYVLFGAFRFIIGLILPGLTSEFNLSSVESGIFGSAPVLSSLLTMVVAGYVSDRLNRKIVLTIGMSVLWSGALFAALAPNFLLALFFIFVAGLGAGFLPPSIYSIMGNLRPGSRGAMVGVTSSVYNFGGFVSTIGLGFVIALEGWRFGLLVLSSLGLIFVSIIFIMLNNNNKPNKKVSEKEARHSTNSIVNMLRSRKIVFAGTSLFMATYASFVIITWMPTYLIHFGINLAHSAIVIGAYSLAGGVAAILSGRLADKRGEKRLILYTGTIAVVVSLPIFLYQLDFPYVVLFMILLGFLVWPSWNLITSMVQRLTDLAGVGTVTGVVQTFGMSGAFVGPILTGFLIKLYGLEQAMIVSVVTAICLYVILIIPSRN